MDDSCWKGIKQAGRPKGGKARGRFVSFRNKLYSIGKNGSASAVEGWESTQGEGSSSGYSTCSNDHVEYEVPEPIDVYPPWPDEEPYESFWEGDFYSGYNSGW